MLAPESSVYPTTGRGAHLLASVVLAVLWLYRTAFGPLLGPSCRFAPSCSQYASQAVRRYGVVQGSWMAVKRVLHCHPFHPGGWDPVR